MPDSHALDHYDDRELDELLDRALTSYVDQEPDPSLRTRIMARTADASTHRTWRIGWLAATACAAALLLAFLLYPANRAIQNRTVEDRAVNAPAATTPAQPPAASAKLDQALTHASHRNLVAVTRHSDNRRRPTFSRSAAPLTEEEATLLRFAQQHPEQAREVLSPPPSGPIHIDPVIIAPIQIAALSASQPDAH